MVNVIQADTQPVQNLTLLQSLPEADRRPWGHKWIHQGLATFEKMLEKHAGVYCYGDSVTMADLFLVPQVINALRFNVDMSEFPLISRIDQTLNNLPEFQKAAWNRQADCPPDLKAAE
jgi:maleylacetoacetate isomerase